MAGVRTCGFVSAASPKAPASGATLRELKNAIARARPRPKHERRKGFRNLLTLGVQLRAQPNRTLLTQLGLFVDRGELEGSAHSLRVDRQLPLMWRIARFSHRHIDNGGQEQSRREATISDLIRNTPLRHLSFH